MIKDFLLDSETCITKNEYEERKKIIDFFKELPEDFFAKLRHFQPQIGCLNACSICSKYASTNVSEWSKKRVKNIIAALKYSSPKNEYPLIVWDRNNHRNGVIFSYLDNDIGFYENLDFFIKNVYEELGVKTRISTVGFSRHNKKLNTVHKNINKNIDSLAGVRLSFTPYSVGWCKNNKLFNRKEYEKDMINFFRIYRKYYKHVGGGSRKFCIELRFKPLVQIQDVLVFKYNNKTVINCGKNLYVSVNDNIKFKNTEIEDPFIHRLSLNNKGELFNKILLHKEIKSKKEIINLLDNKGYTEEKVRIYRVKNKDGFYYAINPQLTDEGCYGLYIYPKTKTRKKSGYIRVERYFINALLKYKKDNNISKKKDLKWKDVKNIIKIIEEKSNKSDLVESNYINNEILPMITAYYRVLKKAKYSPAEFFDKNFTIDTGIICNLGRAINEFKGLVSVENEPLTLNHERNYGQKNSTMTVEGVAWRLSCEYNDKIIVEKLDLADTSSTNGQVKNRKELNLEQDDIRLNFNNLKANYYIPGQRRR